ncbi:hypothetical protein [Deinococcus altitudinis]|uniref:hypothetical protein n=1 Tax=Deinococcus altitudinis TaxID=468914 RepID=UPI003891B1C7
MSRGPGRVMRGVLEALEAGPLSAPRLALTVGASEGSTRRALRTLARRRAVVCLGFEFTGGQRWALQGAAQVEDLATLWPPDRVERLTHFMGPRFTQSMRRALVSGLG